jgi:hypothetical protein
LIELKTIIAGSRSIGRISSRKWDYDHLAQIIEQAVLQSGFDITEVISGGAGGPDRAGEQWAARHGIPVTTIKPNWKLGRGAGLIANKKLAEEGESLIAIFDGTSKGTQDMIEHMRASELLVHVVVVQATSGTDDN